MSRTRTCSQLHPSWASCMKSGPVDHAKHPADDVAPPRSVWLRAVRLAISLVILWCLWLLYPIVSIRICAARVASFYEPVVDSGTGMVTNYVRRPSLDPNRVRGWEEALEGQPTPRLLALL